MTVTDAKEQGCLHLGGLGVTLVIVFYRLNLFVCTDECQVFRNTNIKSSSKIYGWDICLGDVFGKPKMTCSWISLVARCLTDRKTKHDCIDTRLSLPVSTVMSKKKHVSMPHDNTLEHFCPARKNSFVSLCVDIARAKRFCTGKSNFLFGENFHSLFIYQKIII
jgi:hypothetical protein